MKMVQKWPKEIYIWASVELTNTPKSLQFWDEYIECKLMHDVSLTKHDEAHLRYT